MMIKKYSVLILLIAWSFFLLPKILFAASVISDVTGEISEGSSITVSGNSFGVVGPNVIIFDDYEKGVNGEVISTLPGSAAVNQWWEVNAEDSPRYSNSYAHSGSISNMQAWDESLNDETTFQSRADFGSPVSEGGGVYLSYWIYIPTGGHVPGAASGLPNWKLWTVYGRPFASSQSSPYVQTIGYDELPTNYYLCPDAWYDNDPARDFMLADSHYGIYDPGYCPLGMNKGQWHRLEAYLQAGSSDNGVLGAWELNASLPRRQVGYQTGLTTIHSGDYWDTVGMPAYGRGGIHSNPLTKTYYDDIYVSTGQAARARVELGDNSDYDSCTNLAVMTPDSWSTGSIVATVRLGSFIADQTAYLFVVDALGEPNSEGFPVTIGSSGTGDSESPNAPGGLTVN